MAGKGDWLEGQYLDHAFGLATFTQPTGYEVALFESDPGDTGNGTEVTAAGYGRTAYGVGAGNWERNGGQVSNTNTIETPEVTAATNTITAAALYTNNGELAYYGPLTTPKTLEAGEALRFPPGFFQIEED